MFIFEFLNDKIYNYVLFDIIVNLIIQNLKNKHTFLKKLSSLLFEESLFIFQVLNSQLDHPFRTSANFHDF